jgi:hypothetical protein
MTSGWKLDPGERDALLCLFPPAWPDVIADHVTLESGAGAALAPPATAEIVGQAGDGRGVQAMVVSINGTVLRPDGSTYHITWSIDRSEGRDPIESNAVIRNLGWQAIDTPVSIRLTPAVF